MRRIVAAIVFLTACGGGGGNQLREAEQSEALTVATGPRAVAYDFAAKPTPTRGIAGDQRLVFVGEPLIGKVSALDRFTGAEVGVLPPPPGGWILPFGPKLLQPGLLYVLDTGGFPVFGILATPKVHLYRYWTAADGFHAEIQRTDDFNLAFTQANLFAAFSSDMVVLSDGGYILTEQISGSLWRVSPTGVISPGIVPSSPFAPIPQLSGCLFPPGTVVDFAGVPFSFFGDFAPGTNYLAANETELFWENPCQGKIFAVPLAVFSDGRQPWARAADARVVSLAAQPFEILGGMTFNKYNPADRRLYVTNPYKSEIISVNVTTGERRSVVRDPVLFNSPANVAFLPPVLGITPLMVASSQEHRLASVNSQIPQDIVQPPWIVAKIYVSP